MKKKEDDLEKMRKEKEDVEAVELKYKPNLIAKQNNKRHIPLVDRVGIIQAKKQKEIDRQKREQEERVQRELKEYTFAPKINHQGSASKKEHESQSQSIIKAKDQLDPSTKGDSFHPKINQKSKNMAVSIFPFGHSVIIIVEKHNREHLKRRR